MRFHFSLTGYTLDQEYQVTYADGCLRWRQYRWEPEFGEDKNIPVGGKAEWEKLLRFLETSRWERKYQDSGNLVLDGVGWELRVEVKGRKIRSGGYHVFPPNYEELVRLLNAIALPAGLRIE